MREPTTRSPHAANTSGPITRRGPKAKARTRIPCRVKCARSRPGPFRNGIATRTCWRTRPNGSRKNPNGSWDSDSTPYRGRGLQGGESGVCQHVDPGAAGGNPLGSWTVSQWDAVLAMSRCGERRAREHLQGNRGKSMIAGNDRRWILDGDGRRRRLRAWGRPVPGFVIRRRPGHTRRPSGEGIRRGCRYRRPREGRILATGIGWRNLRLRFRPVPRPPGPRVVARRPVGPDHVALVLAIGLTLLASLIRSLELSFKSSMEQPEVTLSENAFEHKSFRSPRSAALRASSADTCGLSLGAARDDDETGAADGP